MLVLQLPGSSERDFEELIAIEEAVREKIGEAGEVDGQDIGSGEKNIFLLTQDPTALSRRSKRYF